jgi:hypothetical protein
VCRNRQLFDTRGFWGQQTGPNPTDRAKHGSKRHLICDGRGIPLAIRTTGANRHDSTQTLALLDGIPPLQGLRGRPGCRPHSVLGDRAYDAKNIRRTIRARRIVPLLACATHGMAAGWDAGAGLWNAPSHG